MKNQYNILFPKLEGKSSLERPRCRCEDNIKTDIENYDRRV